MRSWYWLFHVYAYCSTGCSQTFGRWCQTKGRTGCTKLIVWMNAVQKARRIIPCMLYENTVGKAQKCIVFFKRMIRAVRLRSILGLCVTLIFNLAGWNGRVLVAHFHKETHREHYSFNIDSAFHRLFWFFCLFVQKKESSDELSVENIACSETIILELVTELYCNRLSQKLWNLCT